MKNVNKRWSDEDYEELLKHIDSDVLPVNIKPTKEDDEEAEREHEQFVRDWSTYNAM